MKLTPTPVMWGDGKSPYRGLALSQMGILRQAMALGNLVVGTRRVTLGNGVVITCSKVYNREDIYISVPAISGVSYNDQIIEVTGIIFHPRSGEVVSLPYTEHFSDALLGAYEITRYARGVAGGWINGATELATSYVYPLVDSDNASFLNGSLTIQDYDDVRDEPVIQVVSAQMFVQPGQYGNLYWDNGAVYDSDSGEWDKPYRVLSWRGTPTRHFALPQGIDLPGFSVWTGTGTGITGTPKFSTFGTILYRGGKAIASAPRYSWPVGDNAIEGRCLILGAAQVEEVDGNGIATVVTYLVTQSDHQNAPERVAIFSDGHRIDGTDEAVQAYLTFHETVTALFSRAVTKPGYFLTLWREGGPVDGFTLIAEHNYGWSGVPFFANASGTAFMSGNGDHLALDGTLTQAVTTVGDYHESATYNGNYYAGTMSFSATYHGSAYWEYLGELPIASAISLSFTADSDQFTTDTVYRDEVYEGVFPWKRESIPGMAIFGPYDYAGPGAYAATGGEVKNNEYDWTYPTVTCGVGYTYGVVTAKDCHQTAVSMEVRFPPGSWVFQSETDHTGSWNWTHDYTVFYGDPPTTKVVYHGYLNCWCNNATEGNPLNWCCGMPGAYRPCSFPSGPNNHEIPGVTGQPCSGSASPYGGQWFPFTGLAYFSCVRHSTYILVCP